ncbi:UNVERIFIED_CONTAM: hypothetical protein FKN15_007266 [Acipenser sinensis]
MSWSQFSSSYMAQGSPSSTEEAGSQRGTKAGGEDEQKPFGHAWIIICSKSLLPGHTGHDNPKRAHKLQTAVPRGHSPSSAHVKR